MSYFSLCEMCKNYLVGHDENGEVLHLCKVNGCADDFCDSFEVWVPFKKEAQE